jgi:hypothetical protein
VLLTSPLHAQPPPELERIGPNATRPLAVGEAGWLLAEPGSGDWGRCLGCTIELLGCNAGCTYRVVARRLDWRAEIDGVSVTQGGRVYLPGVAS